MTFKLVHLERRWLNNTIVLNYIKVPSVYPGAFINSQARATGPLPIATYMRQCLSQPVHRFYMNPESILIFG